MGLFNLFKGNKTTVVVDGVSLNEASGMKGNVPPRDQLQLLRRLARYAEREKVAAVVVLCGNPLHKAPADKDFEGMTVLYSRSSESHTKEVVKIAASKGRGAIVISNDATVEAAATRRGLKMMRVSTFRKAFDSGPSDNDNNNRSDRNNGERSGRGRPPRRRQQKQPSSSSQQQQQKQQQPPERERPTKEPSDVDTINELIDLID